ncbi:MAG: BMP family ABC transporter substrate-binding protein [Kiritimatiellae bacterium]|nr:BMP family ABC transporter substrate-binding protein [Kiritimatiellia bacterium]
MDSWLKLTAKMVAGVALAILAAWSSPSRAEAPRLDAHPDQGPMRIAMISDGGTFDDQSFNQNCREGLEELMFADAPIYVQFYEPLADEQFAKQLCALAERNYRVVIGIGYWMSKALAQVAPQYPKTFFVGVDAVQLHPLENVQILTFQVDECAFPAGYLAAAWADLKDPDDPVVAWIGGMDIDSVNQFIVGYVNGVALYNQRKQAHVRVLGDYTGTFTRPAAGAALARRFLREGADVVFPAAGASGFGALLAAKDAGKWAIGVDSDQFYTVPEASDILLTSCVKRMDRAVRENVRGMLEGQFWGGTTYVGNLANHGIGLASYHAFDDQIPDALKADLLAIQRDILNGRQSTGWKPGMSATPSPRPDAPVKPATQP